MAITLHRAPCPESVACPELADYLPCVLGKGHQRPHTPDNVDRAQRGLNLLRAFRIALEAIVDEEKSECGCDSIGSHACDVRSIAAQALADRGVR